jgi:hypothetical protein
MYQSTGKWKFMRARRPIAKNLPTRRDFLHKSVSLGTLSPGMDKNFVSRILGQLFILEPLCLNLIG